MKAACRFGPRNAAPTVAEHLRIDFTGDANFDSVVSRTGEGWIWMMQRDLGGFGDKRLRGTGKRLLEAMLEQPTLCLQALAKDRPELQAFSGFLDNGAVSAEEMLTTTGLRTGTLVAKRHVLAVQDTTEFNFPAHVASKIGFGRSGNGSDPGLFLHPTIAVDADSGGMIGLVGGRVINRTGERPGDHKTRAAPDKESRRWLEATREAGDVLAGAAAVTMVADRESDIYDLFAQKPANVDLLVRAAQNRRVAATDLLAAGATLDAAIAAWRACHHEAVAVPARANLAARTATVALRFGKVSLLGPARADKALVASVEVSVVDVVEIDAPAGVTPLHWRLLTTHPVGSVAAAREIVRWYRLRWIIEQVFRTLKSAAVQAEASQIRQARRFIKLVTAGLIAAVRNVQIVLARDGATKQAMADAIDEAHTEALEALTGQLEGSTEKLKNPHPVKSLAWFAWIVARLGGWSGYTSRGYKPAGPKTIAHGIVRLDGFLDGWHAASRSACVRLR